MTVPGGLQGPVQQGPTAAPHAAREVAESFGADTARYGRTRPGYPATLIGRIVRASPCPRFLDVGIGTGIAARQFRDAGCQVTGVEVDPRMAARAVEDGFDVEVSRFEDWDAGGRTFDAVVAAQAWHWIDPVRGAVKAAWALRPGGRVALLWNVFALDVSMSAAFADVYRRVDPGLPFNPWAAPPRGPYQAIVAKSVDGLAAAGKFGEVEQWRDQWSRDYTRAEWLDLVPTQGGHALISSDKLCELLDGMGEAVDANGGAFTMDYVSLAVTAERVRDDGGV